MVPLHGYTTGHAGIAVKTANTWRLMAGDAYFHHLEMRRDAPYCTSGLRMYQILVEKDQAAQLRNQQLLRELVRDQDDRVKVMCAHDNQEFEALSGRAIDVPASGDNVGDRRRRALEMPQSFGKPRRGARPHASVCQHTPSCRFT